MPSDFFVCRVCLKKINIEEKIKSRGNICKKCRVKKAAEYIKNRKLTDKNYTRMLSDSVSRSRAKNKELYAKINRKSKKKLKSKNRDRWNFWKRKNEQKHRDMISDRYLRSKKIPGDLFEVKRAQLKLLRAAKQSSAVNQQRGE